MSKLNVIVLVVFFGGFGYLSYHYAKKAQCSSLHHDTYYSLLLVTKARGEACDALQGKAQTKCNDDLAAGTDLALELAEQSLKDAGCAGE